MPFQPVGQPTAPSVTLLGGANVIGRPPLTPSVPAASAPATAPRPMTLTMPSSFNVASYAPATLTPTGSDTDVFVSGAGTVATGYGAYKYALSQAAEKAAAETLEPGSAARMQFGMSNLMGAARSSALIAGVVSTGENLLKAWNGSETITS